MAAIQESPTSVDDLWALLEAAPGTLFAVLDACDEPRVPEQMNKLGERAVSLYRGTAEQDLWAIAPYLATLNRALLQWILSEQSGTPWGFLLQAPFDLTGVRKHLRHFLMIEDPSGQPMYFRFYDPRILPVYLASCTVEEAATFFGPIQRFFVGDESGKWSELVRKNPDRLTPSGRR